MSNVVNENIRSFIRVFTPTNAPATGISGSITVRLYNPLLVLLPAPTINELAVLGIYYVDFIPNEIGAWLLVWDISTYEIYAMQVLDVDVDLVEALKGFSTQAW